MDLPNTRLRRDDSRPMASSPLIVVPIASSVPSCSEPSRYGLARAEHAERLVRRPTLTAPARAAVSKARVGTKKRALRSNKETDEGEKMRCAGKTSCHTPYKACSGFTLLPGRAACQLPDQSTIIRVRPSLTDSSRPRGARSKASILACPPYVRLADAGSTGWERRIERFDRR
jgi:hypothetical protein